MVKYIFILGKNSELSIAEIFSFLEARDMKFKVIEHSGEFIVLEAPNIAGIINHLGGAIKLGEVLGEFRNPGEFHVSGLDVEDLPENLCFGASFYGMGSSEHIMMSIRSFMKKEGLKAGYIKPNKGKSLTHVESLGRILSKGGIEFLFCRGRRIYFGRTIEVHNPFEFQKRDVGRPIQRPIYSIPPRLARIMINLSGKKRCVLSDPFCGIGGILQEAMLMGFRAVGNDIDGDCIRSAKTNIMWLSREYKKDFDSSGIVEGDSMQLESVYEKESIDAIVTEPYLGPPLRKDPSQKEAKRLIASLTVMYYKYLGGMAEVLKPGGSIVIVSPAFKAGGKIMGLDIAKIVGAVSRGKKIPFYIADPLGKHKIKHKMPLRDYEERHRTIREINIIRKG